MLKNAGVRVAPAFECPHCPWTERGLLHYADALRSCLASGAESIAVLEEDAWATPNFVDKLQSAMDSCRRLAQTGLHQSARADLWVLRLFLPANSGWENTLASVAELVACAIGLGAALPLLSYLKVCHQHMEYACSS